MKLEKRSGGGPTEPMENSEPTGKKPVVVYIMVLFIAAFLLMAWSFASHQKSNTEALGRLQSSVSTMQEVQKLQDQTFSLQKELAESKSQLEELKDETAAQQFAIENLEKQNEAMQRLYMLQQQYSAGDYEACQQIIAAFEEENYAEALPRLSDGSVTRPEDRYRQLKAAVEDYGAEEALNTQGDANENP